MEEFWHTVHLLCAFFPKHMSVTALASPGRLNILESFGLLGLVQGPAWYAAGLYLVQMWDRLKKGMGIKSSETEEINEL
jgi:lysophospholipid acyltransferase (LPLAT)-like uncharacterized protein